MRSPPIISIFGQVYFASTPKTCSCLLRSLAAPSGRRNEGPPPLRYRSSVPYKVRGEDLGAMETLLACLQVFAPGERGSENDSAEAGI